MEIKINYQPRGSVLAVTLLAVIVIGLALASYLVLATNVSSNVARSQSWNNAIPVLEAGIEEALTQINYNGIDVNGFAQNRWNLDATDRLYHKTRMFSDNSYYDVSIEAVDPPVIISRGYVPTPLGSTVYVTRKVRVGTKRQSLGSGGITAKGKISFSGSSYVDSFDPSTTTNGLYSTSVRHDKGMVLSNLASGEAIHLDQTDIYGTVKTGSGGTVTYTSGAVGDAAWIAAGNTGVEAGHSASDAAVQFDAVSAGYSSGLSPLNTGGLVGGTNYTYVVNGALNQNYYLDNKLTISGGQSLVVTGGKVKLYVTGDFTTSGSGYVYLAPGASLELYVGGKLTISGSGVVNGSGTVNGESPAHNLSVYSTSTTTGIQWTYSGSAAFIGTVYAPYAAFTLSGSAGATGTLSANTVILSGGASVHFDESLGSAGAYVVMSWNEI